MENEIANLEYKNSLLQRQLEYSQFLTKSLREERDEAQNKLAEAQAEVQQLRTQLIYEQKQATLEHANYRTIVQSGDSPVRDTMPKDKAPVTFSAEELPSSSNAIQIDTDTDTAKESEQVRKLVMFHFPLLINIPSKNHFIDKNNHAQASKQDAINDRLLRAIKKRKHLLVT
jgi:DNA-binding protein H-NS